MKKKLLCIVLAVAVIFSALGVTASAATVVTPTVSLNSISNVSVNTTVTVKGSATTPCYRMSAKYVHNGTTTWLGEVYSNSYSKTFTVTSAGTYTVTLYARSYPESDSRSGNGSKTISFTAYNKVKPSITVQNISYSTIGKPVSIQATSTTPCYRMSANYVLNGQTHWLGDSYSSSYSKTFTPSEPGRYAINIYARSFAETDPRSDTSSQSRTFTLSSLEYAYSIGCNHGLSGISTGDLTGDFTGNVKYAANQYGTISTLESYYNIEPTIGYMRGNNPAGTRRIGSKLVFLNGHANNEHMSFNHENSYGDYATGVFYGYDWNNSPGNHSYVGIQSTDMSKVKLISFVGCNTASETSNLCTRSIDQGATTAVGFTHEINSRNTRGPQWLERYNNCLASNYVVAGAISNATAFEPNSNLGDYAKIYGNSSAVVKSVSGGIYSQSDISKPYSDADKVKVVNYRYPINFEESIIGEPLSKYQNELNGVIEKIRQIDSSFEIENYRITYNPLSDDKSIGMLKLLYCIGENHEIETNKAFILDCLDGEIVSIKYIARAMDEFSLKAVIAKANKFVSSQQRVKSSDSTYSEFEKYYYDIDTGILTYSHTKFVEDPALDNAIVDITDEIIIE